MKLPRSAPPTRRALTAAIGALIGSAALAQSAPESSTLSDVVVKGKRVSTASEAIGTDRATATVSISREALLSAPAGISGLKMLESLPGFNVQANDALGLYEFGNSVSVRAFNLQQIGFLLDEIPMGRSDQFGGSPIYRYVDNETLLTVEASPGAGDVSRASYTSLGPIVTYRTAKPARVAGANGALTLGSDSLQRGTLRLDSGELGDLSGTLSGSWVKGKLWRGPGDYERKHIEAKGRLALAGGGELVFQTVHNDYNDFDSPSITLAQYRGTANDFFGRSGRDFAYLGTLPVLTPTTPGIQYSNSLYAQYYKFAVNTRKDHLYGLTLRTPVGDNLKLVAALYREDKSGFGVSPEAYATSLANYNAERNIISGLNAPLGLQYGRSGVSGNRSGLSARVEALVGAHALSAGLWVERDDYYRTRARYNTEGGSPDGVARLDRPVHLQADYKSRRDTLQLFAKDTLSLLDDKLKLELGFKSLNLDYNIQGKRNVGDYINQRSPSIDANWRGSFLPQVGAVWSLSPRDQVFTSVSKNLALPRGADDVFSAASPLVPPPKAERATNIELGMRSNQPTYNASAVLYSSEFQNRLQSYSAPVPGSPTTETFFQNVGRVSAWGAEFSGQWKPAALGGLAYFNGNVSHNTSRFRDGFNNLALAGKSVPDFPTWVGQAGVTVEAASWALLNLSARHVGERYSNFDNSERIGGYTVVNAYVDFSGMLSGTPLKTARLRLNVDNLFDRDYLGTISPVTTGAATFRPGPPRTVQLTLSAEI